MSGAYAEGAELSGHWCSDELPRFIKSSTTRGEGGRYCLLRKKAYSVFCRAGCPAAGVNKLDIDKRNIRKYVAYNDIGAQIGYPAQQQVIPT